MSEIKVHKTLQALMQQCGDKQKEIEKFQKKLELTEKKVELYRKCSSVKLLIDWSDEFKKLDEQIKELEGK